MFWYACLTVLSFFSYFFCYILFCLFDWLIIEMFWYACMGSWHDCFVFLFVFFLLHFVLFVWLFFSFFFPEWLYSWKAFFCHKDVYFCSVTQINPMCVRRLDHMVGSCNLHSQTYSWNSFDTVTWLNRSHAEIGDQFSAVYRPYMFSLINFQDSYFLWF